MTWNDYHRACSGFYHRQELEWERTRYVATMIYNANAKKPKKPEQLVPLQLDKKRKKPVVTTVDDIARILEYHKTRLNGK